jgi:hypothetical protein
MPTVSLAQGQETVGILHLLACTPTTCKRYNKYGLASMRRLLLVEKLKQTSQVYYTTVLRFVNRFFRSAAKVTLLT